MSELSCYVKPSPEVFTVELTEAQRSALSFAALCEAEALETGREKHEPEVQEAIASLREARRILEQGRQP